MLGGWRGAVVLAVAIAMTPPRDAVGQISRDPAPGRCHGTQLVAVARDVNSPGGSWRTGFDLNGEVDALALDSAGNLYVGGRFTTAGGVPCNYIAKWDGTNWSPLGDGFNLRVTCLVVDRDDNLYAGGPFTNSGAQYLPGHVVKWDGTAWSTVGDGPNADLVTSLAIDNGGNLYATGRYITATGSVVYHLARWNGASWSDMGPATTTGIGSVLATTQGRVYAAGGRPGTIIWWLGYESPNSGSGYVATWDGRSWSDIGSGLDNLVASLADDGRGNVYACGSFKAVGDLVARRLARWSGNGWSALDSGLDSTVNALAFDDAGNLYAGGIFGRAAGVQANRIAMWDGWRWSALGSGTDGSVRALLADGDSVFVGGNFVTAGGAPSSNLAIWRRSPPSPATAPALQPNLAWPNPFNDIVSMSFNLPTPAVVRMEVLDLAGRRLWVSPDASLGPGRHALSWNRRFNLPQGIYFLHVFGPGVSETVKAWHVNPGPEPEPPPPP